MSTHRRGDSQFAQFAELLGELLDLQPEEAEAQIAQLAQGDPALARRLRHAMAAGTDEGYLARSAAAWCSLWPVAARQAESPSQVELSPGAIVERWRIKEVLGRGGMGTVYAVERADGAFEQSAALKMMGRGFADASLRTRFSRERQLLARISHPSIVRLLDGGVAAGGLPYLVMEKVDGKPITAWCDERRLSPEERIRLVIEVCAGVQRAHEALVVHGDLKSSNVLVDSAGKVKLLDFGIAQLLDGGAAEQEEGAGRLALTPQLAAPEQLAGELYTTATDVYGLGMLLCELLAGAHPQRALAASAEQLAKSLRSKPPPDLADVVAALVDAEEVAQSRGIDARKLRAMARGDLARIVYKALEPEREQRYPSAAALAADLECFLAGRPVRARRGNALYRARRFLGRRRVAVLATAVVCASILFGVGSLLWQGRVARHEAQRSAALVDLLVETFRSGDPMSGGASDITARELLGRGMARLTTDLRDEPLLRAELRTVLSEIATNLGDPAQGLELARLALADLGTSGDIRDEASARRVLGYALKEQGELPAAEEALRQAVALARKARPKDAADLAEALDRLADVVAQRGRAGESLPLVEEALALRRALGLEREITESMNNLAVLSRQTGDLDTAIRIHREVLQRRRQLLAEDDPAITYSLDNLGAALFHRGSFSEAAAVQEEALRRSRESWGPSHPQVARAANNLAVSLREIGDLARSESLFVEVVAIWRGMNSGDHPNAVGTLLNLARIHVLRGDLEQALQELDQVVHSWRQSLGDSHPNLGLALVQRASVHRQLGDLAAATSEAREAREILESPLAQPHQYLALLEAESGDLALADGRASDALQHHREALGQRLALYATDHPSVLSSIVAVAGLEAQSAPQGAREQLLEALHAARTLPAPAPVLAELELSAGRALCDLGDVDSGARALRNGRLLRERLLGAEGWRAWEARWLEQRCGEAALSGARAESLANVGPPPPGSPAPVEGLWRERSLPRP